MHSQWSRILSMNMVRYTTSLQNAKSEGEIFHICQSVRSLLLSRRDFNRRLPCACSKSCILLSILIGLFVFGAILGSIIGIVTTLNKKSSNIFRPLFLDFLYLDPFMHIDSYNSGSNRYDQTLRDSLFICFIYVYSHYDHSNYLQLFVSR